ncbi:hypothetical protein ACFCP7_25305 [Paenibacillus elgii]
MVSASGGVPEKEEHPQPKNVDDYVYVTDYVWDQICNNMDEIEPQYVPILLLMEASGFRLVDILNLKQDALIEIAGEYWVRSERTNSR